MGIYLYWHKLIESGNTIETLFLRLIPLSLGAAVSPVLLTLIIVILSSPDRPKLRALVCLVGATITVAIIGVLAVSGGAATESGGAKTTLISPGIDIALGLLLLYLGVKKIIGPKKQPHKKEEKDVAKSLGALLARSFTLGVLLTVTDFSSLVFYLAAAKDIADSRVPTIDEILGMSIVGFGFLAPLILPIIIVFFVPVTSKKLLGKVDNFIQKYNVYISFVVAVIFSAYFIYKGVSGLSAK